MATFRLALALSCSLALGSTCLFAEEAEDLHADNVVVVLDASGSMYEKMKGTVMSRMQAAKSALTTVLSQLPASTRVGILVFSSSNREHQNWLLALGEHSKEEIRRALSLPKPGGGTPLGMYIKKGADRLVQARRDQLGYGSYRLLVVTDGIAEDPKDVEAYSQEIVARGIGLDAIGVEMGKTHTLARVAHSFREARNPESLQKAVSEVFAEIGKAHGQDSVEEDFALLEPLSGEISQVILNGLAQGTHEPIGTNWKPPPPSPVAKSSGSKPNVAASGVGRAAAKGGGGCALGGPSSNFLGTFLTLLFFYFRPKTP